MAINNALNPAVISNTTMSEITIFPNPVSKTLNLDNGFLKNYDGLEIINIYGKTLEFYSFENTLHDLSNLKIDVSNLVNGTYFLNLINKQNKTVIKFVVLH